MTRNYIVSPLILMRPTSASTMPSRAASRLCATLAPSKSTMACIATRFISHAAKRLLLRSFMRASSLPETTGSSFPASSSMHSRKPPRLSARSSAQCWIALPLYASSMTHRRIPSLSNMLSSSTTMDQPTLESCKKNSLQTDGRSLSRITPRRAISREGRSRVRRFPAR